MMKMKRGEIPSCLSDLNKKAYNGNFYPNYKYWAFHFKDKKTKTFTWYNVRDIIAKGLSDCTHNHCSFCDAYPIGTGKMKDTIEHFRPKNEHPLLAYYWGNLFICCHYCQEIPAGWDKTNKKYLLKPDTIQYDFHRYFYFDTQTGEIRINTFNTTELQQICAKWTIFYYKLNEYNRPSIRLEAMERYHFEPDINKKEYRFMFM